MFLLIPEGPYAQMAPTRAAQLSVTNVLEGLGAEVVQYTGRLMRQCDGKTLVQVYDYADIQVPILKRMFKKRMKTYRALGFLERKGSPT